MTRAFVGWGLLLWAGTTLVLGEVRAVARPSLAERLRPYAPGGVARHAPALLSVESFRDVLGPLAGAWGSRLARLFGVHEDAAARLARVHSPLDVTGFRVRQLGASAVALAVAAGPAAALWHAPLVAAFVTAGAPLLAFLVVEQRLAVASARRQERLLLELPVVAEQLGMLLGAGYSLGAAVNRLAARGSGTTADDLRRVAVRLRHGVDVEQALREWAATADVPALDRLVSVLARNREAGDLGRLVSEEARAVRQEVHRRTIAVMERRAQQVWVPVTVATLVPGVLFLAIPFVEALRLFSGP
ncbi:MAG TPA: type II secretion system F family protein [Acidimicrobiales bacterium]|nr:type II secretion system F family protein [Acidimicrobiales bacterium]